jgi:hypothetical protein
MLHEDKASRGCEGGRFQSSDPGVRLSVSDLIS